MLPPALHSDNPSRLGERLAAARHRRFVGRTAERDLFRAALLDRQAACAVLHVHGPGGVGKSALLGEFARIAEELGVTRILLDGRQIEPSPAGFLDPIRLALGLSPEASTFATLAAQPRAVLLIDTYERLAPLDPWLRETCLPQLPAQTLVVLAGRNSPPAAWSADPGWHDVTRALPLRNLRPEESRTYLAMRGIAEARHRRSAASPKRGTRTFSPSRTATPSRWRSSPTPSPAVTTAPLASRSASRTSCACCWSASSSTCPARSIAWRSKPAPTYG
jgi:hypothetical protein